MVHPAIREFFRKNAKKGGKARAQKLTPEQRKDIAARAAQARWAKAKKKIKSISSS